MRSTAWAVALSLIVSTQPAFATTGDGCWAVVNVPNGDVLNLREERSARSAIVARLVPNRHGIIAGGWDVADAEARCLPRTRPLDERWCPVVVYDGEGTERGFAKRRFLAPVDCP